jgi:hypothetical protein
MLPAFKFASGGFRKCIMNKKTAQRGGGEGWAATERWNDRQTQKGG